MPATLIRRIKGFRPLYVDKGGALWASKQFRVFKSGDAGETFSLAGIWMPGAVERLKGVTRLSRRLFRSGFQSLLTLSDGGVIAAVRGAIVRLDPGKRFFKKTFSIPHGSRPLNLCMTEGGKVFFGEYFDNPSREAVHVYGSEDGGKSWHVAHTFGRGEIRHVHGVFYDEYRKGCWILTGDRGEECRIAFTDDNFGSVTTVLSGSQRFRAVTVIPRPRGLIVPTDTPLEQNFIQWIEPERPSVEEISPLPGSAFYSAKVGKYLLISTVVEPSHTNRCRNASLFVSKNDGRGWSELYHQRKDIWPMRYFQYGSLSLPLGGSENSALYVGGRALYKIDEHLLVWDLSTAGDS
ncbi:MAG: hypothetical protein SWE60_00540 [Thermodesulfobacteriota bacterium]|nr:hypothetical protein [Thermodesulfobacteriota bacterium]